MKRLESLDALRGWDMMFIMGLSAALLALVRVVGGAEASLAAQFRHVPWDGLAFYDTIFPLFIFIAGVSFPFSLARQRALGRTTGEIVRKILCRVVALVVLGMLYNGFLRLQLDGFRYASVLGKIGMAWGVGALFCVFFSVRVRVAVLVLWLVGYWTLLFFLTAPDAPAGVGSFSPDGCFPGYLDRLGFTPGSFYIKGKLEPSGVPVSLMGSATSAILGTLAGDWLSTAGGAVTGRKAAGLLAAAICCLVLGLLAQPVCPIVKNLWTPTFSLICGAYSLAMLALFYWLIDVKRWTRWCFPFKVVGLNAITIYLLMRFVNFTAISREFFGGVAALCPKPYGEECVLYFGQFVLSWLVLWFLYRKHTFLKV